MVEARDGAAIVAGAARLCQHHSRAGEERFGILLQAAFRRDRDNERRRHDTLPAVAGWRPISVRVSTQIENPTAGIGLAAPSCVIRPS